MYTHYVRTNTRRCCFCKVDSVLQFVLLHAPSVFSVFRSPGFAPESAPGRVTSQTSVGPTSGPECSHKFISGIRFVFQLCYTNTPLGTIHTTLSHIVCTVVMKHLVCTACSIESQMLSSESDNHVHTYWPFFVLFSVHMCVYDYMLVLLHCVECFLLFM